MMKRAQESGVLELRIHNLREWTTDKHHIVDDAPFGGGQGMVMKPEPIFAAVESLQEPNESFVVLMTPQRPKAFHAERSPANFRSTAAPDHHLRSLRRHRSPRHEHLVDAEISIGDYVLTNGAIAAVVFVDAVVRLLPGVLGHEQSAADDSFQRRLARSTAYTRPAEFRGWKVPDICSREITGDRGVAERAKREKRTRTRIGRDLLTNRSCDDLRT